MIEAEKTGELAREYSYWTKMARSYKGRIKADALKNRARVFSEYQDQAASSRKMQSEIGRRMVGKKSDRHILEQARSQNEMAMQEAEKMIRQNRAVKAPDASQRLVQDPDACKISERAQMQGWPISTEGYMGGGDAKKSVSNILGKLNHKASPQKVMPQKAGLEKKRTLSATKGKKPKPAAPQSIISSDAIISSDESIEPASTPKPMIQTGQLSATDSPLQEKDTLSYLPEPMVSKTEEIPQTQAVRQSALMKGMRSMDIRLPQKGTIRSFQKLGGNPILSFYYRRNGIILKLALGFAILTGLALAIRFRRVRLPAPKVYPVFDKARIIAFIRKAIVSKTVKIFPSLVMATGFLMSIRYGIGGITLIIMGFGWNTILLLRFATEKRFIKMGIKPAVTWKTYLKNFFSVAILVFSIPAFFHEGFLAGLGIATALNLIWLIVYAVMTVFTKKIEPEVE